VTVLGRNRGCKCTPDFGFATPVWGAKTLWPLLWPFINSSWAGRDCQTRMNTKVWEHSTQVCCVRTAILCRVPQKGTFIATWHRRVAPYPTDPRLNPVTWVSRLPKSIKLNESTRTAQKIVNKMALWSWLSCKAILFVFVVVVGPRSIQCRPVAYVASRFMSQRSVARNCRLDSQTRVYGRSSGDNLPPRTSCLTAT